LATYKERRPLKHLNVPISLGIGEGGKTLPQLYDYFLQIDDYIDELKNQSGGTESVTWENVEGKPSSYPPETHNHDSEYAPIEHTHGIGDVEGLQGELDSKAGTGHNHDGTYAPVSHAHATGITQIADPTTATAEDIANKVNELIASLQG
jgi:hypothetical protein